MVTEKLNITLLSPEAKSLLFDLEKQKLISINNTKTAFIETVNRIREKTSGLKIDEILDEVENVRHEIYDKEHSN